MFLRCFNAEAVCLYEFLVDTCCLIPWGETERSNFDLLEVLDVKHMVQLQIACPHRVIAIGLYPAVASRKASEFGSRMTSAIDESAAAKQSSFYASQKNRNPKQCPQRKMLK